MKNQIYKYPEDIQTAIARRNEQSLMPHVRLLRRALSRALGRHGVSVPMAAVLLDMLYEGAHKEPSLISDSTGIPRQTMTSLVDALEKQDFVRRTDHPSDRRRKLLALTETGAALGQEIFDDLMDSEERVYSVLSEKEFKLFVSFANRISNQIDRIAQETSEREQQQ